jgi:heat shock protein HslJ
VKRVCSLAVLLVIVAAFAGCGSSAAGVASTNWKLATLNGQPALADYSATMLFGAKDELAGSTGVNRYMGTYQASGSNLTLKPAASTQMAGPEPAMKQETEFLAALSATKTYTSDDSKLTLKDSGGKELATFTKLVPATLAGPTWECTGYNNGKGAVTSVVLDSTITAVFSSDGSLSGNSGVNTYSSTYKTDGKKITIQPPASTQMAGPQPLMDQEHQYLTALTNAATYVLGPDTLELRAADGSLQVSYMLQK